MRTHDKKAIVEELSGYDTFSTCSRDDLEALVDAGGHFALPPQWSLLHEGIPADAAYVILEGTARVFRARADTELATERAREVLGGREAALLRDALDLRLR